MGLGTSSGNVSCVAGHTTGRTNLMHVLASHQGTLSTNSSYSTDYLPLQTLQIFFDEALLQEVNTVEPYSSISNHTTNIDDYLYSILTLKSFDPHMNYAYKGVDISSGIVGWMRVGIDLAVHGPTVTAEGTLGIPNNRGQRPKAPPTPVESASLDVDPSAVLPPAAEASGAHGTGQTWRGRTYGVFVASVIAEMLLLLGM